MQIATEGVNIGIDRSRDALVSVILDIGEVLLCAGGEVNRVEDTIRRIGEAYGFSRVDIFTINNMIALTVHDTDGRIITQTRRIISTSVDLEKVARANALSRKVCAKPVPTEELKAQIDDIVQNTVTYPRWVRYLAYLVAATAFTVFFGGGAPEAIASAVTSLVLCAAVEMSSKLKVQPIIAILVNSIIMTAFIAALTAAGRWASFDKIIMGNIMLLIPGLGLTTSIRDLITGDTISGLMGICDALLRAFAIAVGCASIMFLTGIV